MREALMALIVSLCFLGVVLAILRSDNGTDAARDAVGVTVTSVVISVVWLVVEFVYAIQIYRES